MFRDLSQSINSIKELDDWNFTEQTSFHLSAVLIPIITSQNTDSILLTKRSEELNHHPGQVSFPGGRAESSDKNALDTALRETHEEVGISKDIIKVAGFLDQHTTVSDFIITPIVGIIDSGYQTRVDPVEVDYAFEVPCEVLLDESNYQRSKIFWQGEMRHFWELHYEEHHIWGATASILRNFALRLTDLKK